MPVGAVLTTVKGREPPAGVSNPSPFLEAGSWAGKRWAHLRAEKERGPKGPKKEAPHHRDGTVRQSRRPPSHWLAGNLARQKQCEQ